MYNPTIFAKKDSRACEMCGTYKMKATFYEYKAILTGICMIICHKCAMREYFGTNFKQNNRYIRWSEDAEQKQTKR